MNKKRILMICGGVGAFLVIATLVGFMLFTKPADQKSAAPSAMTSVASTFDSQTDQHNVVIARPPIVVEEQGIQGILWAKRWPILVVCLVLVSVIIVVSVFLCCFSSRGESGLGQPEQLPEAFLEPELEEDIVDDDGWTLGIKVLTGLGILFGFAFFTGLIYSKLNKQSTEDARVTLKELLVKLYGEQRDGHVVFEDSGNYSVFSEKSGTTRYVNVAVEDAEFSFHLLGRMMREYLGEFFAIFADPENPTRLTVKSFFIDTPTQEERDKHPHRCLLTDEEVTRLVGELSLMFKDNAKPKTAFLTNFTFSEKVRKSKEAEFREKIFAEAKSLHRVVLDYCGKYAQHFVKGDDYYRDLIPTPGQVLLTMTMDGVQVTRPFPENWDDKAIYCHAYQAFQINTNTPIIIITYNGGSDKQNVRVIRLEDDSDFQGLKRDQVELLCSQVCDGHVCSLYRL